MKRKDEYKTFVFQERAQNAQLFFRSCGVSIEPEVDLDDAEDAWLKRSLQRPQRNRPPNSCRLFYSAKQIRFTPRGNLHRAPHRCSDAPPAHAPKTDHGDKSGQPEYRNHTRQTIAAGNQPVGRAGSSFAAQTKTQVASPRAVRSAS